MNSESKVLVYYSGFPDKGSGSGDDQKTRVVPCRSIKVGGQKNLSNKPNANIAGPAEVHTQTYENLTYSVSGIYLIPNETNKTNQYIDWDDIMALYKTKYNGTNPAILNITYGGNDLVGLENSKDIKVVIDSPNMTFDTSDSKNAYMPSGTLNFIETA